MKQELRTRPMNGATSAGQNVIPSVAKSFAKQDKQMFSALGTTESVSTFWNSAHYIREGAL